MHHVHLLIVLAFSQLLCGQQNISGVVRNSRSEALAFSNVFMLGKERDSIITAVNADENGYFEFNMDESEFQLGGYLYASYLTNVSDTVPITKINGSIDLIIKGDVVNLTEVQVVGNKPSLIRQTDRFVFTPSSKLKEGASTLDVIKVAPLINYNHKDDFFSIINKQGTMVIINGRKSNQPKESIIALLRSTPAESIVDIEIITNPGSEYQANTTGGVININLKRIFNEGFSGNINLSSEQTVFNTTVLTGNLNYRKGKLGLRISPFINNSYNFNETDNNLMESSGGIQQTNTEYKRDYLVLGGGFGMDYDINERTLLGINGFVSSVDGDSRQSNLTQFFDSSSVLDSIYSSPSQNKDTYTYNFGNLYFEHEVDTIKQKKIVINIDYNYFKKENTDDGTFRRVTPPSDQEILYRNLFPQDFFNISGSIDYSMDVTKKSKVNLGTQLSNTSFDNDLTYLLFNSSTSNFDIDPNLTNTFTYKENYLGVYVSQTISFNETLDATVGVRVEGTDYKSENVTTGVAIDSSYINFFPNLSINYTTKKQNSISFSFAKRIKRPNMELLLPGRTFYNPIYFEENNPFLLPVLTYNTELLYALKNKYYFTVGYDFSDNQYSQFILNEVINGGSVQRKTYLNYGDSQNWYFQFYTRQNWFNDVWELNFSGNLNYSRYMDDSTLISGDNSIENFNFNLFLNNIFVLSEKKKFVGFLTFRYNSRFEDFASQRTNGLFRNDLGLRKSYNNLSLSVFFSDIFNTYNRTMTAFRSFQAGPASQVIQDELTQSVAVNIQYTFGNDSLRRIKNKKIGNQDIKNRID